MLEADATLRIGARLRAHREASGIGPDELAARLGISRAALYRAEKGEIAKIEVLGRIAAELGTGLDDLLGRGNEYHNRAASLFARMAELEDGAYSAVGVFGPVSYLLTTPDYDTALRQALHEDGRASPAEIDAAMSALRQRRRQFGSGSMVLRSIVTLSDLERFLETGLTGHSGLPEVIRSARLAHARAEVAAIARMARDGGGRVAVRLVEAPGPASSFQIIEREEGDWLLVSPFALGNRPNVTLGVGVVTRSPEAIDIHRGVTERLWRDGISGEAAASRIEALLARAG